MANLHPYAAKCGDTASPACCWAWGCEPFSMNTANLLAVKDIVLRSNTEKLESIARILRNEDPDKSDALPEKLNDTEDGRTGSLKTKKGTTQRCLSTYGECLLLFTRRQFLFNTCRLTSQTAQVIQFGTAHITTAFHPQFSPQSENKAETYAPRPRRLKFCGR